MLLRGKKHLIILKFNLKLFFLKFYLFEGKMHIIKKHMHLIIKKKICFEHYKKKLYNNYMQRFLNLHTNFYDMVKVKITLRKPSS